MGTHEPLSRRRRSSSNITVFNTFVVAVVAVIVVLPISLVQGMQTVYHTNGEGITTVCNECATPQLAPQPYYQQHQQQRGTAATAAMIHPPVLTISPPYLAQERVVNIQPTRLRADGVLVTAYTTTTYYTDYVPSSSLSYGNDGDRIFCSRCTDMTGQTGGGAGGGGGRFVVTRDRAYDDETQSCARNPCGVNSLCQETIGGRPVCSCPPGYSGNPIHHCHRSECLDHADCRGDMSCRNGDCVNPCSGTCGSGAHCEVRNHVPVCSCPAGYKGDPFSYCRRADPEELCHPSPCGQNTRCEVINNVPTCSCLTGFTGSPLSGCRHECESDHECGGQESCKEFRCQSACSQCGDGAQCVRVQNHRAVCECPKGYIGSPFTACKPECYGDVDCPGGRPACFYGICKNPCDGSCGVGADCNLRGLTPICSCPRDMTGDPFVSCRPFTKEDLCSPNPCGTNAQCQPGYDNTHKERPVCTCFPGYTGNPLSHCVRGECQSDSECGDHRACINYSCVDPCVGQCGVGAVCEPKRHLAVCKCPAGTQGDALSSCTQQRSFPVARYH